MRQISFAWMRGFAPIPVDIVLTIRDSAVLPVQCSNAQSDPVDDQLLSKGNVCCDDRLASAFARLIGWSQAVAQAQDDLAIGVHLEPSQLDPVSEQLLAILDDRQR